MFKLIILIFWTKFAQNGCFWSKTEKVNSAIEFCIFELVSVPNFNLNWQFWFFGPNLLLKGIPTRNQKNEYHRWILHIRISLGTKFQLKLTISPLYVPKNGKSEHHYCILHIRISIGTKFQLKLTVFILFLTNFAHKRYFWSKTEK